MATCCHHKSFSICRASDPLDAAAPFQFVWQFNLDETICHDSSEIIQKSE